MSATQHLEGTLFAVPAKIDGATFDFARDSVCLTGQLLAVYKLMQDGQYRTLRRIAEAVGGSEASVSARLRDLRKPRYGKLKIDRRAVAEWSRLYEYALVNGEPNDRFGCGRSDGPCGGDCDVR